MGGVPCLACPKGISGECIIPMMTCPNARLPRARVTADKRPPTDRPAFPLACLSGLWQRPPWPLSRPELEPAAQEAPTVQGRAHGQ